MLAVQPRRLLSRPRSLLVFAIFVAAAYWVLLHNPALPPTPRVSDGSSDVLPQPPLKAGTDTKEDQAPLEPAPLPPSEPTYEDQNQQTQPEAQEQAQPKEPEKTDEEKKKEEEDRREENLRSQFDREYDALAK